MREVQRGNHQDHQSQDRLGYATLVRSGGIWQEHAPKPTLYPFDQLVVRAGSEMCGSIGIGSSVTCTKVMLAS